VCGVGRGKKTKELSRGWSQDLLDHSGEYRASEGTGKSYGVKVPILKIGVHADMGVNRVPGRVAL